MYFEYTNEVYVDERDIERMKKKVLKGNDPEEVFEDFRAGLDDEDYYALEYVRNTVLEYIAN